MSALPFRVLVITDEGACRTQARGVVATLARALEGDARGAAVLVRAKGFSLDEVRALCAALRPVTARARALLLVHTHGALVAELGLDGLHVAAGADVREARAQAGAGALVGASRHHGDALDAEALAPLDYVTMSPVFAPRSKRDARPTLGLDGLARAAQACARPLVALGGVDDTHAPACVRAGARGVAVIAAVMAAHDPRRALATLLEVTSRSAGGTTDAAPSDRGAR